MRNYLLVLLICILLFNINCSSNNLYDTDHIVELSGTIEHKFFNNLCENGDRIIANNQSDRIGYYVLKFDEPIDVKGDDLGGPEHNIKEVQLNYQGVINDKMVGKRVLAKGELYYGITVHHFEKVTFYCLGGNIFLTEK